jgi:hypothetical protein
LIKDIVVINVKIVKKYIEKGKDQRVNNQREGTDFYI